jgi:hypothetical protein
MASPIYRFELKHSFGVSTMAVRSVFPCRRVDVEHAERDRIFMNGGGFSLRQMRRQRVIGSPVEERGFFGGGLQKLS